MLTQLALDGVWKAAWFTGHRGKYQAATREPFDPAYYVDAQVPGEIHMDLVKAGIIQEPCEGTNILAARWVEECMWTYRRNFEAPAEALAGRAWLVFDGLDYAASIFLNGKEVGKHENAFHPCRVEVTGRLQAGKNLLAVQLDSGLLSGGGKAVEGWGQDPGQRQHKRHWLRKPQCQFEWDWAPRLVNVGIHGSVRLEWTADAVRVDQLVPLVEVSPDLKSAKARARLFVEGLGTEALKGELFAEVAGVQTKAEVELKPGLNPCEVSLTVTNPRLWWPTGHGEQHLHDLRVTLRVGGQLIGERAARIGFRRVHVNQEPHPEGGRYFHIEVNNKKIFVKGGNFVPADIIFARLGRRTYDRLTDLALEANYNMLRVWGGGLYESEDFYELCDRKGILVWQEFIFACARYPLMDENFYKSVRAEATHNIRRLARHPSLVLWCGNNELEWGAWSWGWDRGVVLPDHALFHITLPRLVTEEDPTRFYWPSSPYSPDGTHPNRDEVGDQHPWEIGFANTDIRGYRTRACRFPNEGGTLGPTALPTMLACLPEGQRFVNSFAWQIHDNSICPGQQGDDPSWKLSPICSYLGKDLRKLSVEEYCYWGGLYQGEGLREYVDNFRRRMFTSGSAIFWMYNDTWPATRSWTIVDYYLRRTPCFHQVRRAMAPVHLVVAVEKDEICVFGVNETNAAVSGELRFGILNLAGDYPLDRRIPATLAPNASTCLASFPKSAWADQNRSVAFGVLRQDGRVVARNRLFLPMLKDMQWPASQLTVRVEKGQAIFESETFALGVCLDLDGERQLADNFFDVYPGIPHFVPWTAPTPPKVLYVGNLV